MVGRTFKLIKERITKIAKHDRCREAMAATETMGVDPILNRALNEFTSVIHLILWKQALFSLLFS